MTLEDLRRRIDELDDEMVRLLNERADCALQVGQIKQAMGLPLYQPEREAAVLRRVRAASVAGGGPLGPEAIARLFERIIDEARGLEVKAAR